MSERASRKGARDTVIVVLANLGELISVQIGAAWLAHCSYRTRLGFLHCCS